MQLFLSFSSASHHYRALCRCSSPFFSLLSKHMDAGATIIRLRARTSLSHGFLSVPQIRAEAAYLYDAVNLYAQAVLDLLDTNQDPRNGTAVISAIKGRNYRSAMG
jgi:hypothetical protein